MNCKRKTSDDIGKYLHSSIERKEFIALREQLLESRIALEHIAQFQKNAKSNSNSIDGIREQLQFCIAKINAEQKKQNILNELVSLLKGEMTQFQAEHKQVKVKEEGELDKSLKQIQDDIDRISRQKNQQVARIAVLRENADSYRSERVVYSNLFRKMERELKQHEQFYKSELLNSEKAKDELIMTTKAGRSEKVNLEPAINGNTASPVVLVDSLVEAIDKKNAKQKINRMISMKRTVHRREEEKQFYRHQIQQLEEIHSNIRAATACQSTNQILEQFSNLNEKNEELYCKIEKMSSEIEKYDHLRHRIIHEEKQAEFVEEEELRKLSSNFENSPLIEAEMTEEACLSHFKEVCSIFKMGFPYHNNFGTVVQNIEAAIFEVSAPSKRNEGRRKSTFGNVDCLLLKMQRFSFCEKLLDREGFSEEYKKQLNRRTKIKHRK